MTESPTTTFFRSLFGVFLALALLPILGVWAACAALGRGWENIRKDATL